MSVLQIAACSIVGILMGRSAPFWLSDYIPTTEIIIIRAIEELNFMLLKRKKTIISLLIHIGHWGIIECFSTILN